MNETPILAVRDLTVLLGGRGRWFRSAVPPVRAVDGVSFELRAGEIFALVGESGSGKTTLARAILGLQRETSGEIRFDGVPVGRDPPERARRLRREVQYVHQDAAASLDPWWSMGATLRETLLVHGVRETAERRARVDAMLTAVGLDAASGQRYPHELSGGQLRRVALARILLLAPRIVILDEPTSGLDLSVQGTVLNLLLSLRARLSLTYLFISHDLSVVRSLADRVAIMQRGRVVEIAPTRDIFEAPRHPYTAALLAARPRLDGLRPSVNAAEIDRRAASRENWIIGSNRA